MVFRVWRRIADGGESVGTWCCCWSWRLEEEELLGDLRRESGVNILRVAGGVLSLERGGKEEVRSRGVEKVGWSGGLFGR